MINHDFFKSSPILKSLPSSALYAPPSLDGEEPEFVDVPSTASSELRKTVIRFESASPSVSESSSKQSGNILCLSILDEPNKMILKPLQNSEDQRLEYTGESKKIATRVHPLLPVASPFRKPLPHPLPIPDSTL